MRLLLTSTADKSVYETYAFLKSKGVAVYISNDRRAPVKTAAREGLWVVLDSQFGDARQLMLNPNHRVAKPVAQEDMAAMEKDAETRFANMLTTLLNRLLFGLIVCVFIVFVWRILL